MLQSPLLTAPTSKSIAVEGISATILEQNADNYEILLEVNSSKRFYWALHSIYSNNQKTSSASPL